MIKKEKFKFSGLRAISINDNTQMDSMDLAYNVRIMKNGNIKSVCENKLSEHVANNNGFEIKYCHSFGSFNNYFAVKDGEVHWVELIDGELISKRVFIILSDGDNPELEFVFFEHGEIIYVTIKRAGEISIEEAYRWQRDNYILNRFSSFDPPSHSEIEYTHTYSSISGVGIPSMIVSANMNNELVEEYHYPYLAILDKFIKSNYIFGTVYLIYAYKLKDGTIIRQSGINMIETQKSTEDYNRTIYIDKSNSQKRYFYKRLSAAKFKLKFSVPKLVKDDTLVESIVIYSTRNNSFYDFDNINEKLNFLDVDQEEVTINGKKYSKISARSVVDKQFAEVAHSPFYEIAEIDFRINDSIELNFMEHYNNIEMKPIFVPNMSSHAMLGLNKYAYNSRVHLLGVKTIFFEGEVITPLNEFIESDGDLYYYGSINKGQISYLTTLEDDGEIFLCKQTKTIPIYYKTGSNQGNIFLPNMITYPDIRAKKIEVYFTSSDGKVFFLEKFNLTKAPENGYAFYQNTYIDSVASYFRYPLINGVFKDLPVKKNTTIYKNKIIVSQINNPFVFNYENVINVNNRSTIVNGVDTIYHNFADEAFGLYPLYVFTNNGIFALESRGDKSVYSNIIPINSQSTNKGCSSVSAGGQVFFLSDRGLCSVNSTIVTYLSYDVEQYAYSGTLFIDYIKKATVNYGSYYNELVINNSDYKYCYLYSIDSNQFTIRDFGYRIISKDKMVGAEGIYWFTQEENVMNPLHSYVESISGGFATNNRKRIRFCKLIGLFKNDANLSVYGSNNSVQWNKIKAINAKDKSFKKAMGAWRYLKFSVSASFMELESMEIELEIKEL